MKGRLVAVDSTRGYAGGVDPDGGDGRRAGRAGFETAAGSAAEARRGAAGAGRRTAPRGAWGAAGLTLLALAALLAALGLAACGGGGGGSGGGSGPTSPPPPKSGIVFTPAGGSGSGIQLASGSGTQGNNLSLNVQTSGVSDLYAVSFHLTYPNTVMRFTGATEGTLLSAGGTVQTSFQIVESPAGTLVVGLTRLGTVAGISSSGTLLTLNFSGLASGTGTLAFSNHQANNSTQSVIQGLTWSAGSVQATIVPGS